MKRLTHTITTLSIVLTCFGAMAQPANNSCGGAITVPQNGCGSPTAGTTVGATDNWVGTLGCAGNNAEAWFTFVASGTQAEITVTSGTMGGTVELVFVLSSTPPCNGLSLAGSQCGASTLTATFPTTPGSTYYYTVSSTGSTGTFTTCVLSSSPPPAAGFDCNNSALLCNDNSFSQSTSNAGFGTQEVNTSNSCWGSGGERQSKWFKFTVGCTGTLEFNINPVTSSNDYDWSLWDITGDPAGCTTKGNSIACDWSGCKGSTGMSSCISSEPGAMNSGAGCAGQYAAWEAPITVTAGSTYALLVDNFTTSNSGFSLSFGGACGGGTAVIGPDAEFTGEITDLATSCLNLCVTKDCPTSNSTFLWNFGDGTTATTQNACHTYATTGLYNVSLTVTDALGCEKTTSEQFNVGCVLLPVELLEFKGVYDEVANRNKLQWRTAIETDNDYFTLEYSKDGYQWVAIERVEGKGSTLEESSYSVYDDGNVGAINYYRLSQTDFNGERNVFNVVAIDNRLVDKQVVRTTNLLGQEVNSNYRGVVIDYFEDGSGSKRIQF